MSRKAFSLPEENGKRKLKVSTVLIHIALLLLVFINIFPLYWMITFSLKSNDEIQGYRKASDQTRWEEIESSITDIIGDVSDIEWDTVRSAAASSVSTAVRNVDAIPMAERDACVERITGALEENWPEMEEAIKAVDGIFAEEKSEEDWARIRESVERILNEKLASSLTYSPEGDESGEAAESAQIVLSFTNNKWKGVVAAVDHITAMQQSETADPWDAVKTSIAGVMGNQADRLDEHETIYVAPNHVGLPSSLHWANYVSAMKTGNMGLYFVNSLVVSATAIVITLLAAFMGTYAMTRLVWKGRVMMNKFFMLGLTIPIHAAIVPVYLILSRLHWLNTYVALIIPYSAFSLSMAILISIGFMGDIPYDLDEAAFLDGCGVWGIFLRVILPLMMPAVATVGIYTFLQCWNELLFATIFVSSGQYRTLPVGVQQLFGQYTTDWGPIGAALSIATLPTMIVYILLSRRIQEGFIAGAVKG